VLRFLLCGVLWAYFYLGLGLIYLSLSITARHFEDIQNNLSVIMIIPRMFPRSYFVELKAKVIRFADVSPIQFSTMVSPQ
jgi:hypothetical protein